jgi:clan AA aspartic protease
VSAKITDVGLAYTSVEIKVPGSDTPGYCASFLVDTGATDSIAPASELRRVGIHAVGQRRYELADGSLHEYAFGLGQIEFLGEVTAGRVLFGPEGVEPILGVTALESVGIVVDPGSRTLNRLPAVSLKASP